MTNRLDKGSPWFTIVYTFFAAIYKFVQVISAINGVIAGSDGVFKGVPWTAIVNSRIVVNRF